MGREREPRIRSINHAHLSSGQLSVPASMASMSLAASVAGFSSSTAKWTCGASIGVEDGEKTAMREQAESKRQMAAMSAYPPSQAHLGFHQASLVLTEGPAFLVLLHVHNYEREKERIEGKPSAEGIWRLPARHTLGAAQRT